MGNVKLKLYIKIDVKYTHTHSFSFFISLSLYHTHSLSHMHTHSKQDPDRCTPWRASDLILSYKKDGVEYELYNEWQFLYPYNCSLSCYTSMKLAGRKFKFKVKWVNTVDPKTAAIWGS